MRDSLAGHLYTAISRDTAPRLALRIRHPDDCAWRVFDEILTLTTEAGDPIGELSLSGVTLGQLVPQIQALGCTVEYANTALMGYGGEVLIEGVGQQTRNNGDHIYAFDSLMWSVISAYARQSADLRVAVDQAIRQTHFDTADEGWLDFWGASLGVARRAGMSDAAYLAWIVAEVTRPRNTAKAIEMAIEDIVGTEVEIREPWQRMHRLNESMLSGTHHLPNEVYSYFLIQPVSKSPIVWDEALKVIERNRPAGIEVHSPAIEWPAWHTNGNEDAGGELSRYRLMSSNAGRVTEIPLGAMRLDDNDIGLNYPATIYRLRSFECSDGLISDSPFGVGRRISRASICLSEGPPLGDQNAILSLLSINTSASDIPATLSEDLALSDYAQVITYGEMDAVIIRTTSGTAVYPHWGVTMAGSQSKLTALGVGRLSDNEIGLNNPVSRERSFISGTFGEWGGSWGAWSWLDHVIGASGVVNIEHVRSDS